ncbi:MAG: gamma-glutamylcyclotransferase family protein [Synechococcaceae cyanobacterium]|nr:gamma-glutamylcyclotransferase family protein [Synechococcaceae cyanobacterium]
MDKPHLVFVYGTLKAGQPNHHWLTQARPLGEATLPGAVLHDLGPFPMAIRGEGRVLGELYAVDADALMQLDRLEGVPRLYERQQRPLADGRLAWVYLGRTRQVRHSVALPQGLWPPLAVALALLSLVPTASTAAAADTIALCNAWRGSSGETRIRLANRLGAAHYLTKQKRLQTSPEQTPVQLYSVSDLQRVCTLR